MDSFLEQARRLDSQINASAQVDQILVCLVCNFDGALLLHFLFIFTFIAVVFIFIIRTFRFAQDLRLEILVGLFVGLIIWIESVAVLVLEDQIYRLTKHT